MIGTNMPIMPRPEHKATKIAYKILGIPDNIRSYAQESPKKKEVNRRLIFEETNRVR